MDRLGGKNCTHPLAFLKSRKDCADRHGHFQARHTHSLAVCECFLVALFLPPLFIIMSRNLRLNEKHGSRRLVCRYLAEKTLPLFPSLPPLLPPSLPDKSKWNGSFHPSYLGQAMEYAALCKEMERNDLWPTKKLQITIYSLIWVLTVGIRRAGSRHSLPRLWGLCVLKCIFLSPAPINADRNQRNNFSEGVCLSVQWV